MTDDLYLVFLTSGFDRPQFPGTTAVRLTPELFRLIAQAKENLDAMVKHSGLALMVSFDLPSGHDVLYRTSVSPRPRKDGKVSSSKKEIAWLPKSKMERLDWNFLVKAHVDSAGLFLALHEKDSLPGARHAVLYGFTHQELARAAQEMGASLLPRYRALCPAGHPITGEEMLCTSGLYGAYKRGTDGKLELEYTEDTDDQLTPTGNLSCDHCCVCTPEELTWELDEEEEGEDSK